MIHINEEYSIKIGSDEAPLKVIEYINLRCPDSKEYEEKIAPYLDRYIQEGKVQRVIKHFDKAVYGLEKGNLLNQYLNYDTPKETYTIIQKLFKEQAEWGQKRITKMPHLAAEYGLTLHSQNQKITEEIMKEVETNKIEMIPTVFVNNQAFIETIDLTTFKKAVEAKLKLIKL